MKRAEVDCEFFGCKDEPNIKDAETSPYKHVLKS